VGKEGSIFFEKEKQKTFVQLGPEHSVFSRASRFLIGKSFLLLSFKKEDFRLPS